MTDYPGPPDGDDPTIAWAQPLARKQLAEAIGDDHAAAATALIGTVLLAAGWSVYISNGFVMARGHPVKPATITDTA